MGRPEDGQGSLSDRVIPVGLGKLEISEDSGAILLAMGIGSTLVVAAYDPLLMIGGLLHAMLPHNSYGNQSPTKFVDSGIMQLKERLAAAGADEQRMVWRFTGGAQILLSPGMDVRSSIARQNIAAAQEIAVKHNLTMSACDVGGHKGRTVFFYLGDGRLRIHDSDGHDHNYDLPGVAVEPLLGEEES